MKLPEVRDSLPPLALRLSEGLGLCAERAALNAFLGACKDGGMDGAKLKEAMREFTAEPAAVDVPDDEPRLQCRKCGTKWYGSKLVPVWGTQKAKHCTGPMEKV